MLNKVKISQKSRKNVIHFYLCRRREQGTPGDKILDDLLQIGKHFDVNFLKYIKESIFHYKCCYISMVSHFNTTVNVSICSLCTTQHISGEEIYSKIHKYYSQKF